MEDLLLDDSLQPTFRADISPRAAAPVDDMETARKRMRHLAPWNVAPVPLQSVIGASPAKKSAANEERCRRLALQVLAVQIAQTRAKSALS